MLTSILMIRKFYQSIYSGNENHVNSNCADGVEVDLTRGRASVIFNDGSLYTYKNVSRKAIAAFMMDEARSLGHFINKVLKQERVIGEKKRLDNVSI